MFSFYRYSKARSGGGSFPSAKTWQSLILLALLFSPTALHAGAISYRSQTGDDQALASIIDGLQRKYSRMKGLKADFVQIYQGSDGRTKREAGQLLLKRPGKARWSYTNPEPKLFVSDGKNIYFYVQGDKHAARSTVKASADPQIPFLFLLGRGDLRRDFSRIELVSDERAIQAGNRVLRLIPKRAPEEFKKLLVEVNPSTFEVSRMVIVERAGARMNFVLSNVHENFVAPDGEFTFTPPPGVTLKQAQ